MNTVLPRENARFTGPNIVVCEGLSDIKFLKALLDIRRIESFEIGCPVQGRESADGRGGMLEYLQAVKAESTRAGNGLRSLAVMLDSDTNPTQSLTDAQAWLTTTGFEVPERPFQWTAGSSGCRIAIAMIPGFDTQGELRPGTLEHLLVELAGAVSPDTLACVQQYIACLGGHEGWSENNKAKMKVQAIIAGRCRTSPAISLAWVWSNAPNIFPLENPMLDFIGNLFRQVL